MTLTETSRPRGHRLWLPITFTVVMAAAVIVVRLLPELERNLKQFFSIGLGLLWALLVLLWFLLLSRYPWQSRVIAFVAAVVLFFGLKSVVRVDGTADGTGLPRFAWRWSPERELPKPPASPEQAGNVAEAPGAKDAPDYFGPGRDGVVRGAGLVTDWKSQPPKELWRHPVGAGWSSFVVAGGRAFTQEQRGEEESVTCYELLTGRLLWMHTHPGKFAEWQGGEGPRGTPVVSGGRVYAMSGTGVLVCLEAATGNTIWSREVLKEYNMTNLIWGVSVSPLVFEDTVVVTGGNAPGPTVLAFRATTGEPMWQAGKDGASYASPILATLVGQRVVVSLNANTLTAHDTASGAVLLEYPWAEKLPAKAAQPVVVGGDRVFISAGYGAGCVMLKIEPAAEGKLGAVALWQNLKMKTQFNSVALSNGHIYGLDDGKLACLNAETGERLWKEGRFGNGQSLVVDDLVIVQSETGDVVLCSAKPGGYEEHGRIAALDNKTWNHPVLAGRYLLTRNDREAACYELPVR